MAILNVGATRTYKTINAAYSAASHGDTLFIDAGLYTEQLVMSVKLVNLVGNTAFPESELVMLRSPGTTNLFTVSIAWNSTSPITVYLEGLSIQNAGCVYNYSHAVKITGDAAIRLSGLTVMFNKCILRANTTTSTAVLVSADSNSTSTYMAAKTIIFNHCTLYMNTTYKRVFDDQATRFYPASARVITKSKLNLMYNSGSYGSTTYYDFASPYQDWLYTTRDYVGYGPEYGTYFSTISNSYKFTGTVMINGVPVCRELRVFRSDNDAFVTSTTSSGTTGYYELFVPFQVYHYVICLDDSDNIHHNDLIRSKCLPIEI